MQIVGSSKNTGIGRRTYHVANPEAHWYYCKVGCHPPERVAQRAPARVTCVHARVCDVVSRYKVGYRD